MVKTLWLRAVDRPHDTETVDAGDEPRATFLTQFVNAIVEILGD